MSLDDQDLQRLARLSRLALPAERAARLRGELDNILGMVDQLRAADTSGVEALAHPLGMTQRLRADAVSDPVGEDGRENLQQGAPAAADGLYLVPRVIE
jgi:aspartyl/glutamyl-tRNA(Asn/Gln) amidotransferase subunit C (EC 6.3.5.-)